MTELLTPEMAIVLAAARADEAALPDPFDFPPHVGRALNQLRGARWSRDLPEMAEIRAAPARPDPALGTGPVQVVSFVPPNPLPGVILHVHGGGWAYSPVTLAERFARDLALASRRPVLAVDYGLAPERAFPGAVEDVVAAWRAIRREPGRFGARPGPLVLSGDSAGANLALAAMLHEAEANGGASPKSPAGALLLYGAFLHDPDSPSLRRHGEAYGPCLRHMEAFWGWYVPEGPARRSALASPLLASDDALAALPPLVLLWAEVDALSSDTERLLARLRALGRADEAHMEPGVVHGFLQMGVELEAARRCTDWLGQAAARLIEGALV